MTRNRRGIRPLHSGQGHQQHDPAIRRDSGSVQAGSPWAALRGRWARPGSVWPVALEKSYTDAETLPGWLLGAIVKIVALYSEPGQQVLLLASPTRHGESPAEPNPEPEKLPTGPRESGPGLLTGLTDAAQTAARLDRTLHVRTAPSTRSPVSEPGLTHQSGFGLLPQLPDPTPTHTDPAADPNSTAVGPDRYDVVITFVDPRDPDWVTDTPWPDLLTPNGTLAFITHSDHQQGRLLDPNSLLTHTAHRSGLTALDHIVLLESPISRSTLTTPQARKSETLPALSPSDGMGTRHIRLHSDLYLFTRPGTEARTEAGETRG
ncbi:hypothetical protein ABTY63_30110 [Streptomyces solisilvae]|uniref:hypothetical protein n=1 Tax=Streptomyces malaysiensis TaxID=92644 RepID=UPI0033183A54